MGNVLVPVIGLAEAILPHLLHGPNKENPTLAHIEALQQAERAQRQAEQATREAHERAEQIQLATDSRHIFIGSSSL